MLERGVRPVLSDRHRPRRPVNIPNYLRTVRSEPPYQDLWHGTENVPVGNVFLIAIFHLFV